MKGLNEFPLISINAVQSTEVRRRDAERHTLICAYNKYRWVVFALSHAGTTARRSGRVTTGEVTHR